MIDRCLIYNLMLSHRSLHEVKSSSRSPHLNLPFHLLYFQGTANDTRAMVPPCLLFGTSRVQVSNSVDRSVLSMLESDSTFVNLSLFECLAGMSADKIKVSAMEGAQEHTSMLSVHDLRPLIPMIIDSSRDTQWMQPANLRTDAS
jgi:hypothetical protein